MKPRPSHSPGDFRPVVTSYVADRLIARGIAPALMIVSDRVPMPERRGGRAQPGGDETGRSPDFFSPTPAPDGPGPTPTPTEATAMTTPTDLSLEELIQ